MIKNITFRKVLNDFQTQFQNDMNYINNNDKIVINHEIYKIEYKKFLTINITECYKKSGLKKLMKLPKTQNVLLRKIILRIEHSKFTNMKLMFQ